MRRQNVVLILLTCAIIVLILARVFRLSELGATNFTYAEKQKEISDLRNENISLKQQILYYSSLSTIEREARSSGFVDATYYYLK